MRRRPNAIGRTALASLAISGMAGVASGQATINPETSRPMPPVEGPVGPVFQPDLTQWWNHAVFYQVFVRSFADATKGPLAGDGVGDFDGLIEKLDYLNDGDPKSTTDLGVTAIWLMPVMEAPSYHGYDVVDYKSIDREYGTNESFKRFMAEAKKRNIRVILDLIPNHCSENHPWFKEAVDPASPKHDWFVWSKDKPAWKGPWNQEVWHPWPKEGVPREYYYGIFWKGMPDLNFRNKDATAAMFDVVKYWLLPEHGGVDGYRVDAVRHLIEEGAVQESTAATHAWLKEFHTFYKSVRKDVFTVGEVWADTNQIVPYIGRELDSCFEFQTAYATIDAINEGAREKLDAQWSTNLSRYPQGQYSTFLSNHDQERVMSRLGGGQADSTASSPDSWRKAKLAAVLLLTSPGIPFIYYGEEIGMVGKKPDEDIRTPMQWGSSKQNAGFTTGKPWRAPNADTPGKNVDTQQKDPASLFNLYRKLIHLRRDHEALRTGTMTLLESSSPAVYAFAREHGDSKFLVIANLSGKAVRDYGVTLPFGFADSTAKVVDAILDKPVARPGTGRYRPATELPARGVLVLRVE